ncbi:MAG: hypothetical protein ACYSO3_07915, partial [Planctomycetota bacterium]
MNRFRRGELESSSDMKARLARTFRWVGIRWMVSFFGGAVDRGNRFCTPLPRMNEAPKADGGRWGPKGAHQTAQGHQAIFELSADG